MKFAGPKDSGFACLLAKIVIVLSLLVLPLSHASASHANNTGIIASSHLFGSYDSTTEHQHQVDGVASDLLENVSGNDVGGGMPGHPLNAHETCCVSFCDGALETGFQSLSRIPLPKLKTAFLASPLAPGEWATPHRPPSI